MDHPSFHTSVVTGPALLALSENVRGWRRRDCFSQLTDYLYGPACDRVCLLYGLRRTGKTTLLRDLIRAVSEGEGCVPLRVSLADERGEVAAMYGGRPQLDVGRRTDVAEGCPKAQGLMLLLRAMNPQVLAVDEITDPADVRAVTEAAGCGTRRG